MNIPPLALRHSPASERGDRVSTMTDVTREELFEALTHACQVRDFAYIDRLLDQLLEVDA